MSSIVYNKHYPRGHSDLVVSVIDCITEKLLKVRVNTNNTINRSNNETEEK